MLIITVIKMLYVSENLSMIYDYSHYFDLKRFLNALLRWGVELSIISTLHIRLVANICNKSFRNLFGMNSRK